MALNPLEKCERNAKVLKFAYYNLFLSKQVVIEDFAFKGHLFQPIFH